MTEKSYLNLMQSIMDHGIDAGDRTGTGTRSIFAPDPLRFDMCDGFPLLTTKKVSFHNIATELLWFIDGGRATNFELDVRELQKRKVKIWDQWRAPNSEHSIGPMYGAQWRYSPKGKDPLWEIIEAIKKNPLSRRHVLTSWVHDALEESALAPCHGTAIQFYVRDGELDLFMFQRSADTLLGLPYNIASYALLLHIVAHLTDLVPRYLTIQLGDAHIYHNHFQQVQEQLTRKPSLFPILLFKDKAKNADHIDDFALGNMESSDFELRGYNPQPAINAPVAV